MSYQDFVNAANTLHGESLEEENLDLFQDLNINEITEEVGLQEEAPPTEQEIEEIDEELNDTMTNEPRRELKALPRQREIFKENIEPENVFATRLKFYELLEKLKIEKKYYLDPHSLDMLSRIMNNKYWYNMSYDKTTEQTVEYLMSLF